MRTQEFFVKWARRVIASFAVIAVMMALSAVTGLLIEGSDPINKLTCDRITIGMTKTEVEKLLGGPPGDYSTRPLLCVTEVLCPQEAKWGGNDGAIYVRFDDANQVSEKSFVDYRKFLNKPPRVTDWLHAQFH